MIIRHITSPHDPPLFEIHVTKSEAARLVTGARLTAWTKYGSRVVVQVRRERGVGRTSVGTCRACGLKLAGHPYPFCPTPTRRALGGGTT